MKFLKRGKSPPKYGLDSASSARSHGRSRMSAGFFDQAQAQFRKRRHLSYFYDNS